MNHKIKISVLVLALAFPGLFVSSIANACHKQHHCKYSCYKYRYSCEYTRGMPLVNRVVDRLRADPDTRYQPIYVSARGHTVMLSGYVDSPSQRQTAIDVTKYTCGVGRIIDEIKFTP